MWIRAILCLLLSMEGLPAWAQSPGSAGSAVIAQDSNVPTLKASYAYWYSDNKTSLENVLLLDASQWTKVDRLGSYGFTKGEYWIHLSLEQSALSSSSHIIRFVHPVHDVVDVHVLTKSGEKLNEWHMGDTVRNIQRPVQDKHPSFEIVLDQHRLVDIYIRVSGINAMRLTMEVLPETQHQKSIQTTMLVSGLMYGILLVMTLYNFGLAVSIRDTSYFLYVGYVFSYILFVLCLTGDGYYYLWTDSPNFNSWMLPIISGVLMIPTALFPMYLLDVKKYAPKLLPIFYSIVLIAVCYLIALPFLGAAESLKLVNAVSFFGSIVMLLVGIYLSIKKVPIALIYTVAWFILLAGLVALPLSSLGLIESNFFTRYSNMLGGVLEAILLSLALAKRIGLERQQRIEAIKQTLKLKEEVSENRKMFQELFDYAPIGMFRFTTAGELVAVNQFLAELMGFEKPSDVVGVGADMRLLFDNGYELAKKALNKEVVTDQESVLTMIDGGSRTCSVTLRMYTQRDVDVIEGFITDITERKQAQKVHEIMEKERMATVEQLVTGVAHEINTPLGNNITSVSHISELLKEVDSKMQDGTLSKNFFTEFVTDCQSLMSIMTSNLQKISSLVQRFKLVSVNQMDIVKANFNFHQHAEDVFEFHSFLNDGKKGHQDIKFNITTHGHEFINSYPAAWRIILDQLFENTLIHAFKDNQKNKTVWVELDWIDEQWQFSYEDNGQGISEEMKLRIFDPFVTTKRGSSDNAGLGMYRVYNIVHQVLKGEVKVDSAAGFKLLIKFK